MIQQVGGAHYSPNKPGGMQHWDWVAAALDSDYFLGCSTKYICRHRRKNGKQDLEKALTYVLKKREIMGCDPTASISVSAFAATMTFLDESDYTVAEMTLIWTAVQRNLSSMAEQLGRLIAAS